MNHRNAQPPKASGGVTPRRSVASRRLLVALHVLLSLLFATAVSWQVSLLLD